MRKRLYGNVTEEEEVLKVTFLTVKSSLRLLDEFSVLWNFHAFRSATETKITKE